MSVEIWNQNQVDSANGFQNAGIFHPFTCENGHGDLVATKSGWKCRECSYIQGWAHGWMLDWSWRKMQPFAQPEEIKRGFVGIIRDGQIEVHEDSPDRPLGNFSMFAKKPSKTGEENESI